MFKKFIFMIIVALALSGCATMKKAWVYLKTPAQPDVIIYKYDYAVKPPIVPPGATPEIGGPLKPLNYPIVYPSNKGNKWDDPTLVIFVNQSSRTTFEISIDGARPIKLVPYEVSSDLHLDFGDHSVRITGTIDTFFGKKPVPFSLMVLRIDSYRRPYPIYLYAD